MDIVPVFTCEFNPERDIAPVDSIGFFDLRQAYLNGSIPADASVSDTEYNDVDDPDSLIDRPQDIFESYRQAECVVKSNAAAQSAASTLGEQ